MAILVTCNTCDISDNDITYNWFYLQMTLLLTANKNHTSNVVFINVSKVITGKVFISIVLVS